MLENFVYHERICWSDLPWVEVPTEVYILQEKDKIMALFAEVDTQPGLAFVS